MSYRASNMSGIGTLGTVPLSVVRGPLEVQKQKALDQRAAGFSGEGLVQLSSKHPTMTNLHGVYKNLIVEEPLWFLRDEIRFSQENRQKSRLKTYA